MNVAVFKQEEVGVSWTDLVRLLHLSFEERLSQGLKFTCSSISVEQFEAAVRGGVAFVAMDTDNNMLLGTCTVHIYTDKHRTHYGYLEYVAIDPSVKHIGIGTKLLSRTIDYTIACGGCYLMSDTAVNADSSVLWHLKNGFRIYGYESFPSTNYYSYIFLKNLNSRLAKSDLHIKGHFLLSWVKTRISKDVNGNYSQIGHFIKRVKRICKNYL